MLMAVFVNDMCAEEIYDDARKRNIPVEISFPQNNEQCVLASKCPVAFLSAGYGISHLKYTFLTHELNQNGYLVIAIGHELPSDPPLSVSGNLYETRSENWIRGANTLDFLKIKLSSRFSGYNFEQLTLVGHSNGGDISAWLANSRKGYIKTIITLDHRRVPLPRTQDIQILSIRASDFPADKGVLPTAEEQQDYASCIITIPNAKHNDIADFGPQWLKTKIQRLVRGYLVKQKCEAI